MPRRIPDYPDVYWAWNYVSSVGSLVSFIGVGVFFYLIFDYSLIITYFFKFKIEFI